MPRAIPRTSMRRGSTTLPLVLIGLGLTLVMGCVFGGVFTWCNMHASTWLVPVLLSLFATTGLAHRLLRPTATRYLARQRGKIVEAMG